MNRIMNKKIENPFNDNQKSFLRLLSKIAKNKNLLGNAGRKYLYEGGIYKELFLNRIFELMITFSVLYKAIDKDHDKVNELIEILDQDLPKIILNEHVDGQEAMANKISDLFKIAYKNEGQEDLLNLLKEVERNRTLLSESFIKTITKLSKHLESIKPSIT